MQPDPAWTIQEASDWFARSGLPISPARLEAIIAALPGITETGRAPSGPRGGRGKARYPVRDLMLLHTAITPWLAPSDDDEGQTSS